MNTVAKGKPLIQPKIVAPSDSLDSGQSAYLDPENDYWDSDDVYAYYKDIAATVTPEERKALGFMPKRSKDFTPN